MAKRGFEECIPLILEHSFEEKINELQDVEDTQELYDLISKSLPPQTDQKELNSLAIIVMNLCRWKESKQIYRFTPECYQALSDMDDMDIPMLSIKPPYPCVYFDLRGQMGDINGAFVFWGDIKRNGKQEHYFSVAIISGEGRKRCFCTLSSYIKEDISAKDALRRFTNNNLDYKHMSIIVSCLAYISSVKPDITANEAHARIYKPGNRTHMQYKEIAKWDVGVRYTKSIQSKAKIASQSSSPECTGKEHNRPRPHVRKAHWHHYRIGPGRKEICLKWIAPVFINVKNEADLPAVSNLVEKPIKE